MAIRIARRDARRYKWRSALIVTMVGLPVLLLCASITFLATDSVSPAESVPQVMGSAQARVSSTGMIGFTQSPDGASFGSGPGAEGAATPAAPAVPGFDADSPWTSEKLQRVTGGRVIPVSSGKIRGRQGDRRPSPQVLGIDARDPLARGMTELVSGRWASSTSEVVVTEAGIARGLPAAGTLTTSGSDGRARQLSVVGVATATTNEGLPSLVALPAIFTGVSDKVPTTALLLERADPVTWAEVKRMNGYGLLVLSRDVTLHPPSKAELGPEAATDDSGASNGNMIAFLMAAGLFVETTLLVGPAFAVSAARQRRSLAIAASNGAEARQLRRYVLGQGIVLGVATSAVSMVAGVLLTIGGLSLWRATHPDFAMGPLDVSVPAVLAVFGCAVVASLVAATLPARGMARLDIAAVMAGRGADRALRRGLPVVGAVVMALSTVAIIGSVAAGTGSKSGPSEIPVVIGAVGLVLGCLLVVPASLALVARLGTRLVLPLRLAARDTGRQRGRSTPAVAAIMASVAVLTALSVAVGSDQQQEQRDYQPATEVNQGQASFTGTNDETEAQSVRSVFREYAPSLALHLISTVGTPYSAAAAKPGATLTVVAATPAGCSDSAVLRPTSGGPDEARCRSLASENDGSPHTGIQVISPEGLAKTTKASAAELIALRSGRVLVFDPHLIKDGHVSFVTGRIPAGTKERAVALPTVTGHQQVPAAAINATAWKSDTSAGKLTGGWVLPETAARLGWPVAPSYFEVTSPTKMIPVETEAVLNDHLDGQFRVERGFRNSAQRLLLVLFIVAGLLVLIASLVSTALSLAESQSDMGTLAAIGATRRTRRGIAASQALVVAACGCLLGLAVGLIPGIALTWPLTGKTSPTQQVGATFTVEALTSQPPTLVIPWLVLTGICVGVPLLAGALGWLGVRSHPKVTRRLA